MIIYKKVIKLSKNKFGRVFKRRIININSL